MARRPTEVERIRRVYAGYDREPAERRKRDPRNAGNAEIMGERGRLFARLLAQRFPSGLGRCRVLDVGCGSGSLLAWLHGQGVPAGQLCGVDLLPDRVAAARAAHPEFTFQVADAEQLGFAAGTFDLVTCWTLFSSILDDCVAARVAVEIDRVLVSEGAIGWYDVRLPNPWNPNTRCLTRRGIARLFPGYELRLRGATVLPPLARRLGAATPAAYPLLAAMPPLRSHSVGLLLKRA